MKPADDCLLYDNVVWIFIAYNIGRFLVINLFKIVCIDGIDYFSTNDFY